MKIQLRNSNGISKGKIFSLVLIALMTFSGKFSFAQGTWAKITATAPDRNGGAGILLSDGSVMVKTESGGGDGIGNVWNKLTPDASGSYINGTWSTLAPMTSTRLYYSTQVLKDGRVYVIGGEYGSGVGNKAGEVYNPLTNTWTLTPLPGNTISDANSEILEDGRVLQAEVCCGLTSCLIYNPATNTYGPGPTCLGIHNESVWVKLPDNSILFVNRLSTSSERYIPASNTWTVDATVPLNLYDPFGDETGGGLLLPDGRVFFLGSTGKTVYYTPSGSTAPGTWSVGPTMPGNNGTTDATAAMMNNGRILCCGSPTPTSGNVFKSPTYFYEFDYLSNTYTQTTHPGIGTYTNQPSYVFNMLGLPNGDIFVSRQDTQVYFIYTPNGSPLAAGQPTLNNITQNGCNTFTMTGKLFNGISEGSTYGDDWQNATNYPIVRLTSTANVVYFARTSNWNSTGVQRFNKADTAQFTTPLTLPWGTYSLQVIANGIPSQPTLFTPYPYITSSLTPPAACSNAAFTYTATGPKAGTTYSWTRAAVAGISNAAVSTPQTSNPNEILINTTASPVSVIYSYTSSAFGCSTSQQVTVVVNPAPTVSVSPSSTICSGSNATLTASGATSYTWSNSANGPSITVNPTSNTIYTVTGSNSFGCTDSEQDTITVNPLPTIFISTTSHSLCAGETATLTANGGVSYVWYDNTTGTSEVINPTSTVWYWVTGTNSFGCSKTDSIQILVDPCTGIKEIGTNNYNVQVYPNPAFDKATIDFTVKNGGSYVIKMIDVTGRIIKEENGTAVAGKNSHILNFESAAKGTYMIVLQKGDDEFKTKMVVK